MDAECAGNRRGWTHSQTMVAQQDSAVLPAHIIDILGAAQMI